MTDLARSDTPGIQYPVAFAVDRLVWAEELASNGDRPSDLLCVGCGQRVVLRAGTQRTAHFAHHRAEACTAPETVLHRTAKRVIADAIVSRRSTGGRYPMSWECRGCELDRTVNLASRNVSAVYVERSLGSVQPDVVLMKPDGAPGVAIEVVVTHPPEPSTLAWFAEHQIAVVQVYPTWESLATLKTELRPDNVTGLACTSDRHRPAHSPTCHCGSELRFVRFEPVVGSDCTRCGSSPTVFDVIEETEADRPRAASLSEWSHLDLGAAAAAAGGTIARIDGRWSFTCGSCGARLPTSAAATSRLQPWGTLIHLAVCDKGHLETVHTTVLKAVPPRRMRGTRSVGLSEYRTVDPRTLSRLMFGGWEH